MPTAKARVRRPRHPRTSPSSSPPSSFGTSPPSTCLHITARPALSIPDRLHWMDPHRVPHKRSAACSPHRRRPPPPNTRRPRARSPPPPTRKPATAKTTSYLLLRRRPSKEHRTPISNAGVCKGIGMIWQVETVVYDKSETPFTRFFVGTRISTAATLTPPEPSSPPANNGWAGQNAYLMAGPLTPASRGIKHAAIRMPHITKHPNCDCDHVAIGRGLK